MCPEKRNQRLIRRFALEQKAQLPDLLTRVQSIGRTLLRSIAVAGNQQPGRFRQRGALRTDGNGSHKASIPPGRCSSTITCRTTHPMGCANWERGTYEV